MNRIIPILPCQSVLDQVTFYEQLGFETVQVYTRPNSYAVVRYSVLELHFYGNKKLDPKANPQMCYVNVVDVDQVYAVFTAKMKETTGKIPRSGIPRISKLKDLSHDRRFIVTDLSGNTLYVGTPNAKSSNTVFYRTLDSEEYAPHFETLYDLTYSKEDYDSASKMLEKFFPADLLSIRVSDLDLVKILLTAIDLHIQRNGVALQQWIDKLQELVHTYDPHHSEDWHKIAKHYHERMQNE